MKHVFHLPLACVLFASLFFTACSKDNDDDTEEAQLGIQFKFDADQVRLNNLGLPATMPAGHAAQTPTFNQMSVHYIELAPGAFTLLGQGAVIYHAAETTQGGETAVDFKKAVRAGEDSVFLNINLSDIPPGTYEWIRASVTYQNYGVKFNIRNVPIVGDLLQQTGQVSSFVGFNTYIESVPVLEGSFPVNANKKQGFWTFETQLSPPYNVYNEIYSGQAPAGATTVVNPLFDSSPVPAGSCVVTGKLAQPLIVTGNETTDRLLTLSFSINQSFEWIDANGNGQLDVYADGTLSEQITDMGLRGLVPYLD
ncbi:MAG: hypothetical protein IT270_03955 [Saprospiraceae bacterium]|nr:hypothetical protein [Saprospiraceae bacterium]